MKDQINTLFESALNGDENFKEDFEKYQIKQQIKDLTK